MVRNAALLMIAQKPMNRDTLPTLEEILAMIETRPANVELIHIARAAGSSMQWLHQVINKKTKDPSYNRMRLVYEFLIKKQRRLPVVNR